MYTLTVLEPYPNSDPAGTQLLDLAVSYAKLGPFKTKPDLGFHFGGR